MKLAACFFLTRHVGQSVEVGLLQFTYAYIVFISFRQNNREACAKYVLCFDHGISYCVVHNIRSLPV